MGFRYLAQLAAVVLTLLIVGFPTGASGQNDPAAGFGMVPLERGPIPLGADGARLLEEALALEEGGEIHAAIEKHKEIVAASPNAVPSINAIAGLYGVLGSIEEQIDWARLAIQVDPEFSLAYINLGNGLLALGDTIGAGPVFALAAEMDQSNPMAFYGLGQVEEARGNFPAAARWYQQSVEIDSEFADGWFNLGIAQANMGHFTDAIRSMTRVLDVEPSAEDAKAMLEEFKRVSQ